MAKNIGKNESIVMKDLLNKIEKTINDSVALLEKAYDIIGSVTTHIQIKPDMTNGEKKKLFYISMLSRKASLHKGVQKILLLSTIKNDFFYSEVMTVEIPLSILLRTLMFDSMIAFYAEVHLHKPKYIDVINYFCRDGFKHYKTYISDAIEITDEIKYGEQRVIDFGLESFSYSGKEIRASSIYKELKNSNNDHRGIIINSYHLYQWYSKYEHFTVFDGLNNSFDATKNKLTYIHEALKISIVSLRLVCIHLGIDLDNAMDYADDQEDVGLGILLQQANTSEHVSRESIFKALGRV